MRGFSYKPASSKAFAEEIPRKTADNHVFNVVE